VNVKKLLLLLLLTGVPCFSQQSATVPGNSNPAKADAANDGMTRDQANAILTELKAIHQLLEKQSQAGANAGAQPQAPQKVSMKIEPGWQVMGRDDAPVTVVEFGDYQCPFCRKYHSAAFADLKKNYIDTGKIRYVVRDFPLSFHANASNAALAARCAGEQGQTPFLVIRDLMLDTSADLAPESITKYAGQAHLEMGRFHACMDAKKYSPDVQKDVAAANLIGVNATPSFIIGKTAKDQIDGVRIAGALSYPAFETAIQNQTPHATAPAGAK
jgi:protein-disulfide isomerase